MKIPPKIKRIAKGLKPRFPAKNYGLASGVRASEIKLKGSKLSILNPPYLIRSKGPLQSFVCGTASRLAHHESFKHGLDSDMLKMAFPVMVGPGFETFGHGMCRTIEGEDKYLIGLTPFDKALRLSGVTRFNSFWDRFVVNGYQELGLLTADRVIEATGWDLFGKHENFIPFAARNFKGDRLGLLSLRISIKNGYLRMSTTSRVVYFHTSSSAFMGEWASDLGVRLPIDRLDTAVREIGRLAKAPDLFEAFLGCRYSDYFEPEFDLKKSELRAPVAALYNQALPALINIAERLPQEEIAALAA